MVPFNEKLISPVMVMVVQVRMKSKIITFRVLRTSSPQKSDSTYTITTFDYFI